MAKATHFLAALSVALFLAGCGGGAELGTSTPAPADRNVAEQARLKLIDKCMFDPATSAGDSKKGKGPLCQCYAQGVVKQMSQADAANYVSSGGLGWSVKSDEIMNACRKR
jgi:PBP1b-binding outer membrane lipoprotein LpoB